MNGYDIYDYGARGMYPALMMFMSMDPLAEKYYWITPYAYCLNNPIRFVDPDGRDALIWYKNNSGGMSSYRYTGGNVNHSNTYVNKVVSAINYNINNGGGDPSNTVVNNRDITINIYETDGRNTSGIGTAYWNAELGAEVDNRVILSPATGLDHELDHAIQSITNPDEYKKGMVDGTSKQYIRAEEERVITNSEQKTARANGEIKNGKITRAAYTGKPVITTGETSTKVNQTKTNEYNKKRHEKFHNTFSSE